MTTPIPQSSSAFDDIFVKLGLAHVSAEEKQRMLKEMQEIVENRVMLRVMNGLSEEDKQKFTTLNSDQEFEEFFVSREIDPVALAAEEGLKFREELISDASFIQGQVTARTTTDN